MLDVPSPKFQSQDVGFPMEVSMNCMDWPGAGEAGLYVKDAARESDEATMTMRLKLLDSLLLATVRFTL